MRIIRYFVVGGIAATVDLAVFALFARVLGYNYLVVAFFSFMLATAVNYLLCIAFVFQSGVRFRKHAEITMTFLVSGFGLVINQATLWFLVEKLAIDMVLAKVCATAAVFLWNYGARARVVFRER
jgi:putative flippase GtrA